MKKLLWVMAALFVSFAVAAQTTDNVGRIIINSAEEFLKIGTTGYPSNGNYIQTADIDLGDKGTMYTPIIATFSGTYDGGGYTISYKATFAGSSHEYYHTAGDYGLFGYVSGGTLKNMSVSGEVLMEAANGKPDNMNVALLCGHTVSGTTVDHCNVVGSVSTYINASNGGGADAALLIGQADRTTVQCCMGSGNVVGVGWVGGLIGSGGADPNNPVTVKACAFSGEVRALQPQDVGDDGVAYGWGAGYAGGIIGYAGKGGPGAENNTTPANLTVTIELCYVDADIYADNVATGVASVAIGSGAALVKNCCTDGSIVKTANGVGVQNNLTNSTNVQNTHNAAGETVDELERIVTDLNAGRAPGEKAEFDVVDGKIVLYPDGKPAEPCAAVTGLTISSVAPGSLTCSWAAGGSETKWIVSISGGGLTEDITENVATNTNVQITDANLTTSDSNYVLSVVADCEGDGPNSTPATSSFVISCPTITGMSVTPDYTSATVAWTNTETVKAELFQGENQVEEQTITSAQSHTFNFLTPNTTYKVRLSAACGGGDYGEATERVFTTKSLPIVSGLTTAPSYNGTTFVGSVTISWDAYTLTLGEGDYYEMVITTLPSSTTETITTTDISSTKTPIALGSYTVKVRAKYGDNYSDWTDEYPFVISDPNAPKNPTWILTPNDANTYNVTVTWTKGNQVDIYTENYFFGNRYSKQCWKVNDTYSVVAQNASTNEYSYTFTSVEQGSNLNVSIVEFLETKDFFQQSPAVNNSSSLSFTIPIPCFEIEGTPTAGAITQTSATLSGLSSGYVVVLSDGTHTTNYEASGATLSLTGLASATHYTAEVRSYCNREQGKYSSKTVEFITEGCYSPTNVTVTNITPLQAKVSWRKGNQNLSGLSFKYILEEKRDELYTEVQTAVGYSDTSKTFTNLKPETKYRVSVAEQCGTDYGIPTTITFTTSTPGNFVAINTGTWGNTTTWQDGRIPNGIGTITINEGVEVTLDRTLVLTNNYTLTNNGTLLINKGELVNTTNNNNLGNVRISFTATQDTWKFIGAPFTSVQDGKYRLESIEPVSGSDVAVVLYNYSNGAWSNDWATINNRVPQAEGYFAWPFYSGTITFNNDYNTDKTVDYSLNNSDIIVARNVINSQDGYWMSLANPYPAKLDIEKFLRDNSAAGLQGGVVYNFNGSTFDVKNGTSGSLPVCEGFFVNFSGSGNNSVTFQKTQMTSYPRVGNTKSKTAQNPWIEMSLVNKRDKVKFFFVRNPLAEQGYDKYDANKLFATTGVAEPYFVTDGMNLVKEEVKELPYYATLNVRSEQDTLMTFVADKIPEGYRVSLIDGEQTIEMNEGSRYETNISAGENADRFKLLIQNNVGLNQISQADITITNSNRHVAISAEAISNVEVFNALGQRVYQTKASTFTLSGVQSGVYVVRVSTAKGTKSQKIVVE